MLRVEGISHAYQEVVALRGVTLAVASGDILCLLGPSGCGKTTLLRIIAGLETGYEGALYFADEDIGVLPAHQRGLGLMFQDFALFPHLSVAGNVAYGLKRRGYSRRQIAAKVAALLRQVGLEGLEKRDVATLSGGQKQRVALARSLAPSPRLLMLDEPLGALDAPLRDQLALELRAIIKAENLSAIYVTHDHREAYAVADRIAVMKQGRVQQQDSPRRLYHQPRTAFVARFLGLRNIFPLDDKPIIQQLAAAAQLGPSKTGQILIHPSGIQLGPGSGAKPALRFDARLQSAVFRGHHYDITVTLTAGLPLTFAVADIDAQPGAPVTVCIALDAIKFLSA